MRPLFLFLAFLALTACKEAASPDMVTQAARPPEKDLLGALAEKHGFSHWSRVNRIRFTFNVERGGTVSTQRSWIWEVRENRVTRIAEGDTLTYLRSEVDSATARADAGFINDKYWLLAPYQWIWDRASITHDYQEAASGPISGESMAKLTITYGQEGGYTPGDAYDFYFGKDSVVREWVYRRGNQPEPSLATTWEGYEEHGGLLISTMHQNADGSFKLYFTGVAVD